MSRSCPSEGCCFLWLWQFLINAIFIKLWEMLRAEMRKSCLKVRLTILQHKMQSQSNSVSEHQINISARELMMPGNSKHPECWNTYHKELNYWLLCIFLLSMWLNVVCINTFWVFLFVLLLSFSGGYGFYFRHLHQTTSSSLSSIGRVGL